MAFIISLIIIVVYILINRYISRAFYEIAQKKGQSEKRYYWFPFWLGIVGYLLVVALPDLQARPNNDTVEVVKKDVISEIKVDEKQENDDIKANKTDNVNLLDFFNNDD